MIGDSWYLYIAGHSAPCVTGGNCVSRWRLIEACSRRKEEDSAWIKNNRTRAVLRTHRTRSRWCLRRWRPGRSVWRRWWWHWRWSETAWWWQPSGAVAASRKELENRNPPKRAPSHGGSRLSPSTWLLGPTRVLTASRSICSFGAVAVKYQTGLEIDILVSLWSRRFDRGLYFAIKRLGSVSMPEFRFRLQSGGRNLVSVCE